MSEIVLEGIESMQEYQQPVQLNATADGKSNNALANEQSVENITISLIQNEPESIPEPIVEPESIPEPIMEPESVSEPIMEPESVSEPIMEPESIPEPIVEPESVSEPIMEPESVSEPIVEQEQITPELQISTQEVPTLIFIVPYRDREAHYKIFASTMKTVLENGPSYKIFYVNQTDNRSFNRGAMKNIGFLAVKRMYPESYKNITLVFNDVDTMPAKETVLDYKTTPGIIKHFYGFDYTLGGIVSILAIDFERLNGFPNFWAWGFEDNMIQTRAQKQSMVIDRSVFYKIMDPHIIHLVDTPIREVNRTEYNRFVQNTSEGIDSIQDLNYVVNEETGFIDVLNFNTTVRENMATRNIYDLRNGPAPFNVKPKRATRMKMHF